MQIIYANRPGPACPGPGPLESSHVTAAHYLSVSFDLPAQPGTGQGWGRQLQLPGQPSLSQICDSGLAFQADRQSSRGLFKLFLCVCACVFIS